MSALVNNPDDRPEVSQYQSHSPRSRLALANALEAVDAKKINRSELQAQKKSTI